MEPYLRACGGALIAAMLCLILDSRGRAAGPVLTAAACCMVFMAAMFYLRPILEFIRQVRELGKLSAELIGILFKITGIGLLSRIASRICSDSGSSALGKTVETVGCCTILYLMLPLFQSLMDIILGIMGEI